MTELMLKLLATGVLLAGNAFFVLAEFALITVRPTRVAELVAAGGRRAKLVQRAIERMDQYLAAVQLGITMTSLGIGWLGEPAVAHIIHRVLPPLPALASATLSYSLSFATAFILITGLHILLGEQLPKLVAIRRSERTIFWIIAPLTAVYWLSYYPLSVLNWLTHVLLRLLRVGEAADELQPHSCDELRMLLGQSQEAGQFSLDQYVMLSNLFDFGQGRVREVMVTREHVAWLALDRPWPENLEVIRSRKFSKYLLCDPDPDHPVGYVQLRDLVLRPTLAAAPDLRVLARPLLWFAAEDTLEQCLRTLQESTHSFAGVRGADGALAGIVTIEDLVEEIVGEIRDEYERRPGAALADALLAGAARFDLRADTRDAALTELLDALPVVLPGFNRDEVWRQLRARERAFSSAIGHVAALPHARLENLNRPVLVFGRSRAGIAFNAPDGQPVRLLFLMLTPLAQPAAHLRLQAQVARLLAHEQLHARLLEVENRDELMAIVRSFVNKVPE
ncbi:MAG TPA: CNNM domain-containing protein [bacterium]|nr:CNNM domain-containing protein [bacterium]